MPIYEYICAGCRRKFRKLVGVVAITAPLACPNCQSQELNRQISRFARVRNEDDTLDSLADEMESIGDTDDPKVLKRMMREVSGAMGEDLDDEFDQMMEEEQSGGDGDAAGVGDSDY